jgi:hypothetical protein
MTMRRFDPIALAALHRYYMWSLTLKEVFLREVEEGSSHLDPRTIMASKTTALMSHWYGAIYVVIEGWQDLRLSDEAINTLLESPNVAPLKRYRHGTFHYQRDYLDDRFLDFIDVGTAAAEWVQTLSEEFGRFFLTGAGRSES